MTEPTEQEVERTCKYLRGMGTLSDDDYDPVETVAKLLESLSSRLAAERKDAERRLTALTELVAAWDAYGWEEDPFEQPAEYERMKSAVDAARAAIAESTK